MNLEWNKSKASGDLGIYEIHILNGKFVGQWIPFNDQGYRVYSVPRNTIKEVQEVCQIMENDMTGLSLMTNERWNSFLDQDPSLRGLYQ